jgi:hypothetical protein
LTCEQVQCPRHQQTMQRFTERLHGVKPVKRKVEPPLFVTLADEREMIWQGQTVVARKAKLNKVFTCPAHGPIKGHVEGWDLYQPDGRFVATVVAEEVASEVVTDTAPTVEAVSL